MHTRFSGRGGSRSWRPRPCKARSRGRSHCRRRRPPPVWGVWILMGKKKNCVRWSGASIPGPPSTYRAAQHRALPPSLRSSLHQLRHSCVRVMREKRGRNTAAARGSGRERWAGRPSTPPPFHQRYACARVRPCSVLRPNKREKKLTAPAGLPLDVRGWKGRGEKELLVMVVRGGRCKERTDAWARLLFLRPRTLQRAVFLLLLFCFTFNAPHEPITYQQS
jgi:hypothetical protein